MTADIVYRIRNHHSELLSRNMHCFHSNSGKHVWYPTKEKNIQSQKLQTKSQLSSLMLPSPSGGGFRTRSLPFFWRAQLRPSTGRLVSRKGRKSLTHRYSSAGQAHLWRKRNTGSSTAKQSTCYVIYISADKQHAYRTGKINYVAARLSSLKPGG